MPKNFIDAPSTHDLFAPVTTTSRPAIEHVCLDCGRKLDNLLMDRCGSGAKCEVRAAVNFHARNGSPDAQHEQGVQPLTADQIFEQYKAHPDCFIVGHRERDGEHFLTSKDPSIKHTMRVIAGGDIEEATEEERGTARAYLDEFNGI
ncbi:MAG: hypothetical protein WC840_04245 [Candidatus Peribacteraceae bacterium]